MKLRLVTIFSGHEFIVPPSIQRIDKDATHGWQVRYGGTKLFSDGLPADGSRARQSLDAAIRELLHRIATLPAPVALKRGPSANKSSQLPAGISGPIESPPRKGRAPSAHLSVVMPRWGREPRIKSVYIGTIRTYTQKRFREAVKQAVVLREAAVEKYQLDATRARRREARDLRATLRAAEAQLK